MHIIDGIGDVKGLVRENIPKRKGGDKMAKRAGPGESSYTVYDRDIAARAQVWLHEEAPKWRDRPWALFVSFVAPHFPLTAPPAWFYRYWKQDLPMPKLYANELRPHHPYLDDYAHTVDYDAHFESEADVKRAIAGYAGLVSAMDENVGLVLRALESAGLAASTRVVYTSDHGDNLGARGLWGKSTLYEESAGVPLIMAGPGIAAGRVVATPVSHIDCAPTFLELTGVPRPLGADSLPGASLVRHRERRHARAPGDLGVPRDRLGRRRVHAALRPLEVLSLRRLRPAALRPRLRSRGDDGPRRGSALPRRASPKASGGCASILDPEAVDARAKKRQAELLATVRRPRGRPRARRPRLLARAGDEGRNELIRGLRSAGYWVGAGACIGHARVLMGRRDLPPRPALRRLRFGEWLGCVGRGQGLHGREMTASSSTERQHWVVDSGLRRAAALLHSLALSVGVCRWPLSPYTERGVSRLHRPTRSAG